MSMFIRIKYRQNSQTNQQEQAHTPHTRTHAMMQMQLKTTKETGASTHTNESKNMLKYAKHAKIRYTIASSMK